MILITSPKNEIQSRETNIYRQSVFFTETVVHVVSKFTM